MKEDGKYVAITYLTKRERKNNQKR